MAAAHQYSDYSSCANLCASYYNPSAYMYDNNHYSTSGQYDFSGNNAISHNGSHYQSTNEWHAQSSYPNQRHLHDQQTAQQPHYYATFTNDQYHPRSHSQEYHSQNHQQQQPRFQSTNSMPTAKLSSESYSGCSQLNAYHNQTENSKATSAERYQTINKNQAVVKKEEEHQNDSTTLRALLSNKMLRYCSKYTRNNRPVATGARLVASIDSVAMSPNKNDDSLDVYEDFPYGKEPIDVAKIDKDVDAAQSMTMQNPVAMICENIMTNQMNSPMMGFVNGISTPPLSPKDTTESVNQLSDNTSHDLRAQGDAECKYTQSHINISFIIIFVFVLILASSY